MKCATFLFLTTKQTGFGLFIGAQYRYPPHWIKKHHLLPLGGPKSREPGCILIDASFRTLKRLKHPMGIYCIFDDLKSKTTFYEAEPNVSREIKVS